jgi:hypothetical protein
MAQGQIDADATLDLWSICSDTRLASGSAGCASRGAPNPAGEPLLERNDAAD